MFLKTVVACVRMFGLLLATWAMAASAVAQNSGASNFVINGPETPSDTRYAYHEKVLRAALEATTGRFGAYAIQKASFMNEARQIAEMRRGNGLINTLVLDSTLELMRDLVPVRIPIDRGLIGYRVFLIRAENQGRFSGVRTLDDLRAFRMGQGSDWSDVAIYRAAGFEVVTGASYDGLFDMLREKRFDAFGRGATEVVDEMAARRTSHPGMVVERDLLLYYPMPVYFWFPRTPQGMQMAERVQAGMEKLLKTGALVRMFKTEYGSLIEQLQLRKRRLFRIPNPNLPLDEPLGDKSLWFDPTR